MVRSSTIISPPLLVSLGISVAGFAFPFYAASRLPRASRRRSGTSSLFVSAATPVDDDCAATATSASAETTKAAINGDQEEGKRTRTDFLSLDYIRSTLVRQEETIIFALIERALFKKNDVVYKVGGVPGLGLPPGSVVPEEEKDKEMSFLDFMLSGTEALHSIVRRHESPQEYPFFPQCLSKRINSLAELGDSDLLSGDASIDRLNWNEILYDKYLNVILPAIVEEGDDEQYGSTVLSDIAVMQALSKRMHFGKFVAESKYRGNPEGFQKLVDAGDADGVMELLTNAAVEEKILARARLKATTYGREPLMSSLPKLEEGADDDGTTAIIAAATAQAVVAAIEAMKATETFSSKIKGEIDPAIIESIYREIIIPMTKDIEVAYLFLRCGKQPPPQYASDRMSVDVLELNPRNRFG